MARTRRWAGRLGLALLAVILALTLASLAYNAVTGGDGKRATALYGGPFVRVDGTLVAYRRWGATGSPIVLIGGFVEPSWVWAKVGRLLGRRHRVYAVDLPPFGYTQRRGPYTLASWIELVRGFERRLGIERPLVVGHSLGAAVAVGSALAHPAEVAGIVLLDGDARSAGRGARWLSHLVVNPFYTTVYRLVAGSDLIFRSGLRKAYGPRRPPLDDTLLDAWQGPFRVDGTGAAFQRLLGYGIQGYGARELRRVRVPRLVVWGAHDTVDAVSSGRQAAADLHARFVLLPEAGHLSMLVDPRGVARAVEGAAR